MMERPLYRSSDGKLLLRIRWGGHGAVGKNRFPYLMELPMELCGIL
jgi:hypothetical protein